MSQDFRPSAPSAASPNSTQANRPALVRPRHELDARLAWFPQARFGMFVHFGLYSLLGRGEWVMYRERIPREEYAKLVERFNPHAFDAAAWVETAQRAGARYITMTAKHHDGFCLFDSVLTDYKITRTPFGRDLIGELAAACHRLGMPLILYYSQPDWHHPNFVHRPAAFKDLQYTRPDDRPDWPAYLHYCHAQVRELCTRYGPIAGIWFDGVHKTEAEWRGRQVYEMIKTLQPGAVVNDRAGCGDYFTPERALAHEAAAAGYIVEACQAICRDAWGYHPEAPLYSSPLLIESLVRAATMGGNYLLNIGPDPDGSLPDDQVRRLEDIGDWLRAHGEAVYGSEGCPQHHESEQMLYTRKGNRLYLHLLRWPETDTITLNQLRCPPVRATLLKTGAELEIRQAADAVVLRGLPASPPHPAVNVIEQEGDGDEMLRPSVAPGPAPVHSLSRASALALPAQGAARHGFGPKGTPLTLRTVREAETRNVREAEICLARWSSPEQTATWQIDCEVPACCEVTVELACPAPYDGSRFVLRVDGQALIGIVPPTRDQDDFQAVHLGRVELPAGRSLLTIEPETLNYGYVFASVRRVILTPVEAARR